MQCPHIKGTDHELKCIRFKFVSNVEQMLARRHPPRTRKPYTDRRLRRLVDREKYVVCLFIHKGKASACVHALGYREHKWHLHND